MKNNLILKILSSIPIILLAIYIYPFFGICLIILRYFLYKQKRISTPILIITIGILLLIPKYLFIILKKLNITNNIITHLQKIINLEIYNMLLDWRTAGLSAGLRRRKCAMINGGRPS